MYKQYILTTNISIIERHALMVGCTILITPFPLANVVHVARFGSNRTNPIWVPPIFDVEYLIYLRCKHVRLVLNQFSPVDEVIEVDKH